MSSRKKSTAGVSRRRAHSTKSQRHAKEVEVECRPTDDHTATASSSRNASRRLAQETNSTEAASEDATRLEQLFRFMSEDDATPAARRSSSLHASTNDEDEDDDADADGESIHASSWWLLLLLLFGLLVRYGVSGGGYSGQGVPPMFGDYEAQRHWMELTVHLPVSEWYHNTSRNDLQYWGLDYPPLTAYVSYGFGRLAQAIGEGELVALGSSRGYESVSSKYFMRMTVMLCDLLLFLPAVFLALRVINPSAPKWRLSLMTHLVWICPAFILIDHGHFQYNCFSLGLVVYAIWLHWQGRDLLGAVAFVLSMAFKQMSLYYAPAFFAYLLARTMRGEGRSFVPLSFTSVRSRHADSHMRTLPMLA
jgi:hypothetical protein